MPITEEGQYYCNYKSWLDLPESLTMKEAAYLSSLENIFKVKDINQKWIKYELMPHQVWYHLSDVIVTGIDSKIRVIKKSRNTSFTTSCIISLLMSISTYSNKIIPVVRLNSTRAADLIADIKDIIRHMTPIVINGQKFPFDNTKVNLDSTSSIRIGDVEIRSFPANADSSESIRGLRCHGFVGLIDEANFCRYFSNVFVSLRDTSTGSEEFQIDIGTTLKGDTPFSFWLQKMEDTIDSGIQIFDWPVFDRFVFEKQYTGDSHNEIPFHKNSDLVSIVPWHDKKVLWSKYLQDTHTFLEEYMAIKVDSDEQFYKTSLVIGCMLPGIRLKITELHKISDLYKKVYVGIDVASIHDYFVITCIGQTFEDKYQQFYLEYENKVDLEEMQRRCEGLFNKLEELGTNYSCGIDANGIGLHITQNLQRLYGEVNIRGIKGGSIRDADGNTHRLNEYGHTELKKLLINGLLKLIDDDMIIKHFAGWNYQYKCDSTEFGHGDIVMGLMYAILSEVNSTMGQARLHSSSEQKKDIDSNSQWYQKAFKQRLSVNTRKYRM